MLVGVGFGGEQRRERQSRGRGRAGSRRRGCGRPRRRRWLRSAAPSRSPCGKQRPRKDESGSAALPVRRLARSPRRRHCGHGRSRRPHRLLPGRVRRRPRAGRPWRSAALRHASARLPRRTHGSPRGRRPASSTWPRWASRPPAARPSRRERQSSMASAAKEVAAGSARSASTQAMPIAADTCRSTPYGAAASIAWRTYSMASSPRSRSSASPPRKIRARGAVGVVDSPEHRRRGLELDHRRVGIACPVGQVARGVGRVAGPRQPPGLPASSRDSQNRPSATLVDAQ